MKNDGDHVGPAGVEFPREVAEEGVLLLREEGRRQEPGAYLPLLEFRYELDLQLGSAPWIEECEERVPPVPEVLELPFEVPHALNVGGYVHGVWVGGGCIYKYAIL